MTLRSFRRQRYSLQACGALIALVTLARESAAFDSAGAEKGTAETYSLAPPPAPMPFGPGFFTSLPPTASFDGLTTPFWLSPPRDWLDLNRSGALADYSAPERYELFSLHGTGGDAGAVNGLLICDRSAANGASIDISKCRVPNPGEKLADVGWIVARTSWQKAPDFGENYLGNGPEHMWIAQVASRLAGLDTNPLFKQTFWVRYPTADRYVASPLVPDSRTDANVSPDLIVGQSWMPSGFHNVRSHATRAFYLPELAQMPDVSNSVWDWASGNETCPVHGLDEAGQSAFGDPAYDVTACHMLTKVMGSINASHFLPNSKRYYAYYHQLALSRMVECKALTALSSTFYAQPADPKYHIPIGSSDTEAHECEREAMVYEMFAQHYMQDAWATGHMWRRWGYPDLADFPSGLGIGSTGNISSDVLFPPAENVAARRFVIAAVTAGYAGQIHGSKGLMGKYDWATQLLLKSPGAVNDPLCGPTYYDPWGIASSGFGGTVQDVSWRSPVSTMSYPGMGDMFWRPGANPSYSNPSLETDEKYQTQRDHLLACTARSMRDVYLAGPRVHGEPDPGSSVLNGVDPSGDECWSHWVTNGSMFGAVGPLNLERKWNAPHKQSSLNWLFEIANWVIINDRKSSVVLPNKQDGDAFLRTLSDRMAADALSIELTFAENARKDPNGIDSAQLRSYSGTSASFLTIPPGIDVPGPQPPASYLDVPSPRLIDAPESDYYVPRMFWRSHLREVCSDSSVLPELRDRCVNASKYGGDPEACTACAEVAEPFMLTCSRLPNGDPSPGPSKCATLGVTPSDPNAVPQIIVEPCEAPTYWHAVAYCTGADEFGTKGITTAYKDGQTNLGDSDCAIAPGFYMGNFSVPARIGTVHDESSFGPQSPHPIVSAFDETVTFEWRYFEKDGRGYCNRRTTSSIDPIVESVANGLPLWSNRDKGIPALLGTQESLGVSFCGVTQRLSWWSETCADVFSNHGGQMEINPGVAEGAIDPATGAQFQTTWSAPDNPGDPPAPRCSIREKRALVAQCPQGGVCTSGGVCVNGRVINGEVEVPTPPPVIYFDKLR